MATVFTPIDPLAFRPFSTTFPAIGKVDGTNFPVMGASFANSTDAYYDLEIRQYGSGNLSLDIDWYSPGGATTGNVQWEATIAAVTPGDAQSIETKSLATATNATTTVNGTARGLTRTTVTISNLDSLATGDKVWLRLRRTSSSTISGNTTVVGLVLSYSDT